ncbi:FG-GAP repeat domain-containing protein [Pseudohongiella spirulinae]|uniref:VCBS repeat-containing protein n=1 Tax=Pseudohongiella spirulinae TaxID=1249552 RepID=A0A0S2KB68_9GAMM|nr:VCBS repeat-containing protein [Pseudohongiella spirulinae]ALO45575.1 hypothetical protein PS2015_905 [Pseudohongiella spirulinae]
MKQRRFVTAALLATLFSGSAIAQGNYIASEIPAPEWPNNIRLADVDGDGLIDLIVPHWAAGVGRQLLIFQQQADHRFPAQPSRIVDIRPEIVAVTFADVRPEPGVELLLFTGNSVFSLSTAQATYAGNIRHLFDWPFLASVPERRITYFLPEPRDLTGNGFVDLLLPGTDGYGYFSATDHESFELIRQIRTENTDIDPSRLPPAAGRFSTEVSFNEQDGLVVRVIPRSASDFQDFVVDAKANASQTLLETERWLPPAVLSDMTARDAADIVFLNVGNDLFGQINIVSRDRVGEADSPVTWQGPVVMEGDIQLLELNGDGLTDIVRIVERGENWDVFLYLNQGGHFDLQQPSQVMRFSGYDLRISTSDLLQNGQRQLSVTYYTIPLVNAIRNASIVRTQLLYGPGSNGLVFNNRPDFRQDDSFSASSIRGLTSPIQLHSDINGDGRIDALYLTEEGTLAARNISDNLQFSAEPFWQYVPGRTILDFEVHDINSDQVPDILLFHSNTITALISQP